MKTIQWYPGHMAKAVRQMEEDAKLADALVVVLDARCPAASYNPRVAALTAKPVLYVLNKADLADGAAEFAELLCGAGKHAVAFSAVSQPPRTLLAPMRALLAEVSARRREKGVAKPLRFLVAGIPNTGKSTLINLLAGEKRAKTGNKAGVTRERQWVRCGAFELLDTPGLMPPACEDQTLARRLAYVGSINDDILALDEIALCLLGELAEKYPGVLAARYGIGETDPPAMLDALCARRGFIARGSGYDYERGERALLDDLRKGKLGRVCFDGREDAVRAGLL